MTSMVESRDVPAREFAGLFLRTIATTIDIGLLWVAEFAVVFLTWNAGLIPLTEKEVGEGLGAALIAIFWGFPAWPYFTLCERSKYRGTVGKRLLGLQVTDLEGDRIGFGRATARHWLKLVSWLALFAGFVMIGLTPRKQGLHDVIAGTLVVR